MRRNTNAKRYWNLKVLPWSRAPFLIFAKLLRILLSGMHPKTETNRRYMLQCSQYFDLSYLECLYLNIAREFVYYWMCISPHFIKISWAWLQPHIVFASSLIDEDVSSFDLVWKRMFHLGRSDFMWGRDTEKHPIMECALSLPIAILDELDLVESRIWKWVPWQWKWFDAWVNKL